MPRGVAGHIVAAIAANAFVFFGVTSAQGLVILAFGRRAAARLAALAQAGAVLLFLLLLLFMDPVRGFTADALRRGNPADPSLLYFPPGWFLGLYEFVAGTTRPIMNGLALRGLAAGLAPFAVTVAIYAFGYKRLLARAVEAPPRSTRFALVALASRIVRATFVRRPEEQAICAFVLRAVARSSRHSMMMSIYVGAGLALMATSVIPAVARFGYDAFTQPGVAMLSPPLVLSVALAVGMRILMTLPVDLPARWVFQTTGLVPRRVDAGVHKAMLLLVVPPVVLLAGISAWVLWGPAIAWRHAIFCGCLTLILCEVLLSSFTGAPMTRPYVPGRSRFHMWWAFYLTAFTTYCYTMAGLEGRLLRRRRTPDRLRRVRFAGVRVLAEAEAQSAPAGRSVLRGRARRRDVPGLQSDRDLRRTVGCADSQRFRQIPRLTPRLGGSMVHTLRLAFRSLRRRPGFSALAIVTIALGAGANAAVSAVAYSVLLKPLPFAEPDRVVAVWPARFMTQVDLRYLREHARGLARVSSIAPGWTFSLTGAGDPSKVTIDRVSGDLFETLGTQPLVGRVMRADEDRPGSPKVLVLSHHFWQARFGGDPSVVGRTVKLDDEPHEIIGVMPASFEVLTTTVDAWAPLPADRAAFYDKLNFAMFVGRLAPGTTVEQADRDFKALMPAMRAELKYPATYGRTARIQDLRAATTGDMRSSLLLLAGAVALMLLIAGANLGTLLVASGASRAREFAVHAAIGASRGALVRLQLAEGLILAAAGAAAGLALAFTNLPLLVALLPKDTPRTGDIRVDGTVTIAVLAAALLVALLFAIAPSFTAGGRGFGSLREGAATESRATRRTRGAMVSVEIALALVLTIGAGLMLRTLWHLQRVDPGIDVDRILTLRLQPTSSNYKAPGAITAYYDQVLARIGAIPGVSAAGAIQHLPFSGVGWVDGFEVEGRPIPAGEARPTAGYKMISGDYFRAVGQRLAAGRAFTTADRALADPPIIVNETFARTWFGSAAAAIDRRVRIGRAAGPWVTIAGVVGDVRTESLDKPSAPEFYTVVSGTNIPALMIAVRSERDPLSVASAVREAVWSVDRNVPVADLQPMRTMVGTTMARPRLLLTLLGAFSVTGLALGAIGVYGVVAFGVARRRREIGIRMALGANRASVVRLMLGESAWYSAAGLVAGMGLALAASRMMRGLLFEVPATDAPTYLTLALGVGLLVTLASYAPARRAASISPAEALRADR